MDYQAFLNSKSQQAGDDGFSPLWMPDWLYDFQHHLVDWTLRRGRAAVFADCGLGKTPIQLVWAENVVRKTNNNVLILAPLAVSKQLAREADKFGMEVGISRDGRPKGKITVINYERLHKADPSDYVGVVCDECFPPDTEIDTLDPLDNALTKVHIKDISKGTRIVNASGVDRVKHVCKRQIKRAVRIRTEHGDFLCSENHPFFTLHGWTGAKDLRASDYLMATGEAMRVVRNDIHAGVLGIKMESVLRTVLLSEMADEPPGTQSQGTHSGDIPQDRCLSLGMVGAVAARDKTSDEATLTESEPLSGARGESEDIEAIARNETPSSNTGGQWPWNDETASGIAGPTAVDMGCGTCREAWEQSAWISDMLQSRYSKSRKENSNRMRRSLSPRATESPRPEEGHEACFSRVVGVEVLELGHPDLDRYRDADGNVYFYDLEATRHPSFSVQGVLVHNSSILKHWSGKTQKAVTRFMLKKPYRLLCTATPAPNDFVELGTSSEALGYLNHSEMLATFFRQISDDEKKRKATADDITHSKRLSWRVIQSIGQWALKAHAFESFWRWAAIWSRACSKPSDLGPYDDARFKLPPLNRTDHTVIPRTAPPGYLFTIPAFGLNQERAERRRTIEERTELVTDLTQNSDRAVVWCQLNDEGDALEKAISGAVQVKGSQSIDRKEELLEAFMAGEVRVLVTKAKIAGLGLNMQHCAHVVTFVDHSYEKFYQSIRRCWRFGQKRPVRLDVISTEGEVNVRKNMERKEKMAAEMFRAIVAFMNESQDVAAKNPTQQTEVPTWM